MASFPSTTHSLDSNPSSFEGELSGNQGHSLFGGDRLAPFDTPSVFDESGEQVDQAGSTLTLERPGTEAQIQTLSPRFEFSPESERVSSLSWSRRMVQGTVLVALVAAVAAFIVILPDDGTTSVESAEQGTRVTTVDTPTAAAELLSSSNRPQVTGALADAGDLERVTAFSAAGIGTPADNGTGFDDAITAAVEESEPEQATTTTTAWVEPTIPPESEWVDAGNGVLVPDVLLRIRFCESTNNYNAANTSSSARGAYQFLNKSWDWYGHAARTGVAQAHLASAAQQDESALLTLQSQGTSPWLASRSCWASPNIDPRYATAAPKPVTTTTTAADDGSSTTETTLDPSTSSTTDGSTPETTTPGSSTTEDPGNTTTTTAENTTTSVETTTSSTTTSTSTP